VYSKPTKITENYEVEIKKEGDDFVLTVFEDSCP
jgi:hypothetical protein